MKSTVASAVLGAVVFSQASLAATIGHGHSHVHRREPTPDAKTKRTGPVAFMSDVDVALINTVGILAGKNIACTEESTSPVTVGKKGPFIVEFINKTPNNLIFTTWSGEGGEYGAVLSTFIGAQQPDVTHTLQAGDSAYVSYDPSKVAGNSICGGWGAVYPGGGLSRISGQLNETWGEHCFTTASQFSTTDVSRLVNMYGHNMTINNYASEADRYNEAIEPACTADLTKNAYVCPAGDATCMVGKIQGCVAGTPNTTCDASGMDGGCSGMSAQGGYVEVLFS